MEKRRQNNNNNNKIVGLIWQYVVDGVERRRHRESSRSNKHFGRTVNVDYLSPKTQNQELRIVLLHSSIVHHLRRLPSPTRRRFRLQHRRRWNLHIHARPLPPIRSIKNDRGCNFGQGAPLRHRRIGPLQT